MTIFYKNNGVQGQAPGAGLNMAALLRKKATKGDVGIEIEVEGNKFPKSFTAAGGSSKPSPMDGWKYWSACKDGSLRGKDNCEYVLTKPILFDEVGDAIDELDHQLKAFGSKLDDSNRTSVHVHLNCQKFHMNRIAAFSALWFCFEDMLTEFCGEHRVGNLFCLRAKDAPAIVTKLKRFIQSDGQTELSEGLHYSGFNCHALHKFGSIEIRTMRGPTDFALIKEWVSILQRIYEASANFPDPRGVTDAFSQTGPVGFFEAILGDKAYEIAQAVGFNENRVKDSMYEGIRMAQDLIYCRNWDGFKEVNLASDPFGRDARKVASNLQAAMGAGPTTASVFDDISWVSVPTPTSPGPQGTLAQYQANLNAYANTPASPPVSAAEALALAVDAAWLDEQLAINDSYQPEPEYDED